MTSPHHEDELRRALRDLDAPPIEGDLADEAIRRGRGIIQRRRVIGIGGTAAALVVAVVLGITLRPPSTSAGSATQPAATRTDRAPAPADNPSRGRDPEHQEASPTSAPTSSTQPSGPSTKLPATVKLPHEGRPGWAAVTWGTNLCGLRQPTPPALARATHLRIIKVSEPTKSRTEGAIVFATESDARRFMAELDALAQECRYNRVNTGTRWVTTRKPLPGSWDQGFAYGVHTEDLKQSRWVTVRGSLIETYARRDRVIALSLQGLESLGSPLKQESLLRDNRIVLGRILGRE